MALAALRRVVLVLSSSTSLFTARAANSSSALRNSSILMASEHGQSRTNSSLSESCRGTQDSKGGILKFELNDSPCKLYLQRGDITKWFVDGKQDAIVNAANSLLLGGGGVDGAIHRAAGRELYEACYALPSENGIRCNTGDAVITDAFRLPVSKVIHTVGPIYENPTASANLLRNAYKNSLGRAIENDIKYIAFPAISCGIYGYPYDEAAEIALETVNECSTGLEEIHFVLFEAGTWNEWVQKAEETFKRHEE